MYIETGFSKIDPIGRGGNGTTYRHLALLRLLRLHHRREEPGRAISLIVLQRQLSDLGVQRLHVDDRLRRSAAAARTEHFGSTFLKLRLPRRDLVGVETVRQARDATRDRLTAASLARINAPTPDSFRDDARFALDALPALTARADQVKQLRQTILNLAVRGKLVPQEPDDEPALVLLKRLVGERKAIVEKRKIRGAKPPPAPSPETEAFELPPSWQLCSLGQITLVTDPNPSHRCPDYSGGTVPILSTREFAGKDGWNPETGKLATQSF